MRELVVQVSFALYAALTLGGAVWAVTAKSLVRALLGLTLSLMGVAALYVLIAAPLVALMQILIYVGAVVVLIFFAIMLTRAQAEQEEAGARDTGRYLRAGAAGLAVAGLLAAACLRHGPKISGTASEIPPSDIGAAFLGPYVLGFEVISVVLFAAMAGAVVLAFERRKPR
ncbi:NADH-quinone oxidoreductase subunit J [Fundidesulfovibrio soli]|uniref:NADH-quinone oxidoreductase subunit J family protein n=1 Tax=Fundidesulfovibrio soli TaxID=2922716 RepID=UPI001FAEA1C9|nr:NADH-quinone oxidoreductase subunit J [Fundidesulfovibrio soli]